MSLANKYRANKSQSKESILERITKMNKIEMSLALIELLVPALETIFSGEFTESELKEAEEIRDHVMNVAQFHGIVDLVKSEAMAKL